MTTNHDDTATPPNGKPAAKIGGTPETKMQIFGRDFLASIVVFLIALPLCMGIAVASNVPVAAGLISGIIGGVIVGMIAGAPLQVSGPAAGLSVLVYQLIQQYGQQADGTVDQKYGLMALGFVVLVAGAIQIAAGMFRLGQWFRAVSPAVVQGMLAGIGVLIFASQFHIMVDDQPRETGLANLLSIPESFWLGLMPHDTTTHHQAARIGIMTIVILIAWKMFVPKKLKFIPAPLVAVVAATLVADVQGLAIKFIDVPNSLIEGIQVPSLETYRLLEERGVTWTALLVAGLSFALVASAETLLAVSATDRMHQGPRAKYDRELAAQGVGNVLCGLASALPITGVIVRSAANIDAGARTRWSAVMHGVWLLVLVSLLPDTLDLIPKSCLGALLVYTGYKLVSITVARDLWRYGKSEFFIYLTTIIMIVVTDLLTGVLVGIGLSAAKLLYTFSNMKVDFRLDSAACRADLRLAGSVTFLSLPKLARALENVPSGCDLHVTIDRVTYIDHACLDLLMAWQQQHEDTGGKLYIDWGSLHAKFFGGPDPNSGKDDKAEPAAVLEKKFKRSKAVGPH